MCKFLEGGWLSVCVGGYSENYSYNDCNFILIIIISIIIIMIMIN